MKCSPRALVFFLSFVYLALPLILWSWTWLKAPWSESLGFLLLSCCAFFSQSLGKEPSDGDAQDSGLSFATFLWIWAPMAAMSLWSGVGGFGMQMVDWVKHNSVLWDLVNRPWPVRYPEAQNMASDAPIHLTYYLGYYLPAALVGKIAGWPAGNIALQVWSLLGLALVALWLNYFFGSRSRWVGIAFCLFGGASFLGTYAIHAMRAVQGSGNEGQLMPVTMATWGRADGYGWLLRSHVSSYNWVPQHALASWILTSILLRNLGASERFLSPREQRPPALFHARNALCCAVTVFWSPFAVVGAIPFWWAGTLRLNRTAKTVSLSSLQRFELGLCWVTAVLVGVISVWYLLSRIPLTKPVISAAQGVHSTLALYAQNQVLPFIGRGLLYSAIEWGALLALAWFLTRWINSQNDAWFGAWRKATLTAAVVLIALLGIHYGRYNDLMMNSSINALFVIFIFVMLAIRTWYEERGSKGKEPKSILALSAAIVLLLCGTLHTAQLLRAKQAKRALLKLQIPQQNKSVYAQYVDEPHADLLTQYVGPDDSAFARLFLKDAPLALPQRETP